MHLLHVIYIHISIVELNLNSSYAFNSTEITNNKTSCVHAVFLQIKMLCLNLLYRLSDRRVQCLFRQKQIYFTRRPNEK